MKHENNFGLLRLFAAGQVVYMHSVAHLGLPRGGYLFAVLEQFPGVPIFFMISGFLVTDSYLRSSIGSFFVKRALRIYPALFVNIAILELAVYSTGTLSALDKPEVYPTYFLIYVLTASDWIATAITGAPFAWVPGFFKSYPSGVLWTLTVELSFYLILPLFFLRRVGLPLLLMAVLASIYLSAIATIQSLQEHILLFNSVLPYIWLFAIGIVCRVFWSRIAGAFEGKALFWLAGYAIVVMTAIHFNPGSAWLEYRFGLEPLEAFRCSLMALTIIACAFTFPAASRWLGEIDLSYGIYLYHMLFVSMLIGFGLREHWWLWLVVLVMTITAGALSWRYVEQPALSFKGRALKVARRTKTPSVSGN